MSETEKDRGMWNDIKPKQYFGLVGAMIAIAALVQITNFRFIPGPLIVGMPLVAVVIGGRMLWLHRRVPTSSRLLWLRARQRLWLSCWAFAWHVSRRSHHRGERSRRSQLVV